MYRIIRTMLLTVLASTTLQAQNLTALENKTVVVDVSGVLFNQDILASIYSDVSFPEEQKVDVPSIFHHPLMAQLLTLAHHTRPFGEPINWYAEGCLPYELYALFTGVVSTSAAYSKFIEMAVNSGIPADDPLYSFISCLFDQEHFDAHMTRISAGEELLSALRAVPGIKLLFYSNMPHGFVTKHTQLQQLAEAYDARIVTASDIGSLKPSAAFYAQLLISSGQAVHNLVLIDDKDEDLESAEHNGMPAYKFNREDATLTDKHGAIVWQGNAAESNAINVTGSEQTPLSVAEQLAAAQSEIITRINEATSAALARVEALLSEIKELLSPHTPNP